MVFEAGRKGIVATKWYGFWKDEVSWRKGEAWRWDTKLHTHTPEAPEWGSWPFCAFASPWLEPLVLQRNQGKISAGKTRSPWFIDFPLFPLSAPNMLCLNQIFKVRQPLFTPVCLGVKIMDLEADKACCLPQVSTSQLCDLSKLLNLCKPPFQPAGLRPEGGRGGNGGRVCVSSPRVWHIGSAQKCYLLL